MPEPAQRPAPPGLLRLLVVFHESEALGAGRSVVRALGPLAEYGWSASGWFPGSGPLLDEAGPALAFEAHSGKPIRYSARGWRADPGVLARLRDTPAYLRAFRRALLRVRPHVVHANTLRTLPEARIARALGLPVVVHVHELPDPGAKRAVALRAAARTADVLVVVSEAVAEVVRPHAGRTPVVVAHNGVPALPGSWRSSSSTSVIGTIGTVCRTKGTDVYLEAAGLACRLDPELRFEHVGQTGLDEDVEFQERIAALARPPGEPGSVAMLGRVPADEALERWELFVMASRQDAFPLATLEAMAAGVPVISTAVGGLVEQVEHLESGVLVEPESAEALARWIVRLHGDPALRERLSLAAWERVRARFTIERQADALHGAYLAALNLRHGPPPVRTRTLATA